jgi:hypothetical protein
LSTLIVRRLARLAACDSPASPGVGPALPPSLPFRGPDEEPARPDGMASSHGVLPTPSSHPGHSRRRAGRRPVGARHHRPEGRCDGFSPSRLERPGLAIPFGIASAPDLSRRASPWRVVRVFSVFPPGCLTRSSRSRSAALVFSASACRRPLSRSAQPGGPELGALKAPVVAGAIVSNPAIGAAGTMSSLPSGHVTSDALPGSSPGAALAALPPACAGGPPSGLFIGSARDLEPAEAGLKAP